MTKKLKPEPKPTESKRDTNKWQRDRNIARILTIIIPVIILIAIVLIAYWGYDTYYKVWRQSVTTVGNTTFNMDHYVKMLRYNHLMQVYDNDLAQIYKVDQEPATFFVLKQIKEQELVRQAAIRDGIQISEGNITDAIDSIIPAESQNGSNLTQEERQDYYKKMLKALKLSEKEYRTIIKNNLYYEKFWYALKEQNVANETKQVDLYAVTFDTVDQVNEALQQFRNGANNTLANAGNVTVVIGNGTRTFQVQHIGWTPRGIHPAYDDVIFDLPTGNITTIEKTLLEVAAINDSMSVSTSDQYILAEAAYNNWKTSEEARLNALGYYKDYINVEDVNWAINKVKQG